MSNSYYVHGSYPTTRAAGTSAAMRAQLDLITAGFDLLPVLAAHGDEFVMVNTGATALTTATAAATRTALGLVIGTNVQAWDADLDALAALAATAGMLARTGAGTFAVRTITGTAAEITVTNGDGSGAPTLSLPAALTFTGKTVTGGTMSQPIVTNPDNTTQALSWTSGGTTAWNASLGAIATVTATTGNTTFGAPTNLKKGTYILRFTQDSSPRTITWNAVFKWAGGAAPVLSTTAAAVDILTFYCDGTNLYGTIQKAFA